MASSGRFAPSPNAATSARKSIRTEGGRVVGQDVPPIDRKFSPPPWSDDGKVSLVIAGRSCARRSEDICPGVEDRHKVVSIHGGDNQHDRLFFKVDPCT